MCRYVLSSSLVQHLRLLEPTDLGDLGDFEAHVTNDKRWLDKALKSFRHHGFVVLRDALELWKCTNLLRACEEAEVEIRKVSPHGNRAPGRSSFGKASKTGSMLHDAAWAQLLDCKPLLALLEMIMPEGGECVSGGGDFVYEEGEEGCGSEYQFLHSDLRKGHLETWSQVEQLEVVFPPPYVSANFAVQHISADNGPMRIIPGTQTVSQAAAREHAQLPCPNEEPETWLASTLQPLHPGDVIVRDVRVLHGGTPNRSVKTRFLPSLEFASSTLRSSSSGEWPADWMMEATLPAEHYEKLSAQAQAWCPESLVKT
jgi:hypothetical protein